MVVPSTGVRQHLDAGGFVAPQRECGAPHAHRERFAAQGMRFSAAYAPAPVCSPTRLALQTGMNPARLGWTKAAPAQSGRRLVEGASRKSIRTDEVTVAELLRSAGYATAHYGKWHLGGGGPAALMMRATRAFSFLIAASFSSAVEDP